MAITPFKVLKVNDFATNRNRICDFLLLINTDLPPILYRFRDIAFDTSKIAIFGYPTKWHLDPSTRLATIDMSRKLGAMPPFGGSELDPHLIQSRLGRGLTACQVSS